MHWRSEGGVLHTCHPGILHESALRVTNRVFVRGYPHHCETRNLGSAIAMSLCGRVPSRRSCKRRTRTRRPTTMAYLRRLFQIPVNESSLGLVLSICILSLSLMSIALVWQAQIIANQRDDIRWLESLKFGS